MSAPHEKFTWQQPRPYAEQIEEEGVELVRRLTFEAPDFGPPGLAAAVDALRAADEAWRTSGGHDDSSLRAVENCIDQARAAASSLVSGGYVASHPLADFEGMSPAERLTYRQLQACTALLPVHLGSKLHPMMMPAPRGGETLRETAARSLESQAGHVEGVKQAGARTLAELHEHIRSGVPSKADPRQLAVYPDHERLLERSAQVDARPISDDIARTGIGRPLLVTGERCASPRLTILAGHFRHSIACHLQLADVPVIIIDDLTAVEEMTVMARDNLLDENHRELAPSARHRLEAHMESTLCVAENDARVDVNTFTATLAAEGRRRREVVAAATGATVNGVATRKKAIESVVSTPELVVALDSRLLSQSAGAALVRRVEREQGGPRKIRARPELAREGQRRVNAELQRLAPKARLSVREAGSSGPAPLIDDTYERIPIKRGAGGRRGIGTLNGCSYEFIVTSNEICVRRSVAGA